MRGRILKTPPGGTALCEGESSIPDFPRKIHTLWKTHRDRQNTKRREAGDALPGRCGMRLMRGALRFPDSPPRWGHGGGLASATFFGIVYRGQLWWN